MRRFSSTAVQRLFGPRSSELAMRELSEVVDSVFVATSRIMTTTSTVVVGRRSEALLVDPAWQPDELADLADVLRAMDLRVIGGFATHAHHDHLLWHPGLGGAPRWASRRTWEMAVSEREALVSYLGAEFPADLVELMGRVVPVPAPGTGIPPESLPADIVVELVVHDGHAPGHTAVWLARQRVLIAGDMLSDREVPLPFYPDDLSAYLAGLEVLAHYVSQADVLIPGHGAPTREPQLRLDADRRYLDAVIGGKKPDDARLADPEMLEHYDHLVAMVRGPMS
jgi:glyoxylase-like metal-dependent hydrolase (beta-lactamase superfamily II)